MLDPDIQRLLDTVFNVAPATGAPDVALLRAAAEQAPKLLGGEPLAVASVAEAQVPGTDPRLAVRVYRPATAAPPPVVVYAHGGGWVTGSLDSHDRLCRHLAQRMHVLIVAVDYRCAPENVYPSALDDVEAAWQWTRANALALGGDGARFGVAGDSSGGNLAAALTLRLRADGAAQPQLQLLLYPALDATCERASYREFANGYNLSAGQMQWYWDAYRAGADAHAAELSPLAATHLAGLAPAVIAVAESDVLRDDGLDYARRLAADGVPVQLIECSGMIHGFLRWTGEVRASTHWIDAIATAARALFEARV
ncbi:MAG TPA: alpha/beta hydrolase [Casimicrobiaceae bacterium]